MALHVDQVARASRCAGESPGERGDENLAGPRAIGVVDLRQKGGGEVRFQAGDQRLLRGDRASVLIALRFDAVRHPEPLVGLCAQRA